MSDSSVRWNGSKIVDVRFGKGDDVDFVLFSSSKTFGREFHVRRREIDFLRHIVDEQLEMIDQIRQIRRFDVDLPEQFVRILNRRGENDTSMAPDRSMFL